MHKTTDRDHSSAALTCPSCGHLGSPLQLTPDRPDRVISIPVYQCGVCDHVFSPVPDSDLDTSSMIRDCMREDAGKGVRRGGGSKVKRQPKPGDKLLTGYRPEQAPGPDNTAATSERGVVTTRVETKRIIRTFRMTPTEDAAIWSVANARGLTLVQAFEEAMGEWVRRGLEEMGEA